MARRLFFPHLTPSELRLLHLALADAESGTPRQWWHLEIAATFSSAAHPRVWVRALAKAIPTLGAKRLVSLLACLGVGGLGPYCLDQEIEAGRFGQYGASIALCLLCALVGLDALNATREFLLVLCALLGGLTCALMAGYEASRFRRRMLTAQSAISERLTPAENALGLTGLLTSLGYDYVEAARLAEILAAEPDSADSGLLARLGLLAPTSATVRRAIVLKASAFVIGVAAVAWPCWLTRSVVPQLVAGVLGCAVTHYVVLGLSRRWAKAVMRAGAMALMLYALGLWWRR